jgi:hypothetical protein
MAASSTWDWLQFLNDGSAALIGGLAGGGIAAWVAIRQTRTTLQHDAAQAREAAQQEREASRQLLNRQSYLELLEVVGEALRLMSHAGMANLWLGQNVVQDGVSQQEVVGLFQSLRRGSEVLTVLLPRVVRDRWQTLERLMIELRDTAQWAPGSAVPTGQRAYRDQEHRRRGLADVAAYANYVRLTLVALIDGRPAPADQLPPVFQRLDGASWDWPTRDFDERAAAGEATQ